MKKTLLAMITPLVLSLLVSACMQNPPNAEPPAPEPPTADPVKPQDLKDQASCESANGIWRREGLAGIYACVLPAQDAGKACTDSSQCEYRCLAAANSNFQIGQKAEGQCQVNSSPFGCRTEIKGGKAEPTLCID